MTCSIEPIVSIKQLACRGVAFVLMTCCLLNLSAPVANGEALERELLRTARTVLEYSRERGYQNIGVLKFRVKKGEESPSDKVGPLNHSLPDRLELGLILANKVQAPIGIVRNASEVAAQIEGANHLDAEGRQLLFADTYPLAWGETLVTPDAFVTGVVQFRPGLDKMTVAIAVFDRSGGKLEPVAQFDADTTPAELTDIGESFSTRGLFDERQLKFTDSSETQKAQVAVVQQATQVRLESASFPLTEPGCPLTLDIAYDGKVMPIEVRDGRAFVREPQTNQVVTLTLRRKPNDKQRYAAVLKVNGENTLGRERQNDLHCTKWVLEPDSDPTKPNIIKGYFVGKKHDQVQTFRVLSKADSKARAIDYGNDVGTISLVVFRELSAKEPALAEDILGDDADLFAAIAKGAFTPDKPKSLDALKQQLIDFRLKGLIVEGETVEGKTRKVEFKTDPLPVFSATITYYRPE